jgi:hypothetical protein
MDKRWLKRGNQEFHTICPLRLQDGKLLFQARISFRRLVVIVIGAKKQKKSPHHQSLRRF